MIQVTSKIISEIIEKYPKNSIVSLGKEYGLTERRVRAILVNGGKEIVDSHRKTVSKDTYIEDNLKRFPKIEGKKYIAIYKNDHSVRFEDYLNKSGCITSYIKDVIGIDVPSLFLRKKYFHENGKQWHEQWFDIILEEKEETEKKKCPYCNWETTDVNNRSGMFLTHIQKEHSISREEHLRLHPEDREYFSLANKTLDREMETDSNKYVTCAICGKKFARLDWRHLGKHGITKTDYEIKYGERLSVDLFHRLSETMKKTNENMKPVFISKPQQQIAEFIKECGVECELSNRKALDGKEIDIYIPSLKFGIEYNGNFWHSEGMCGKNRRTHLEKTVAAKSKGISLIQIFEDEYFLRRDIVYSKIAHLIGLQQNLPRIMARKCTVKEICANDASEFLENNHIQGFVDSTVHLGAYYCGELVAVMSFKREKKTSNEKWELTRFASDNRKVCQGIGGKLFKHFIREYSPSEIKSFADRRWTINEESNIYIKLGFKFEGYLAPEYRYYNAKVDRYHRFHKFGFRKQILAKKYGFPMTMTETEMTEALGYKKIWDCGLIKYVWKKTTADS